MNIGDHSELKLILRKPSNFHLLLILDISSFKALRMIIQLGVKPAWFDAFSTAMNIVDLQTPRTPSAGDFRGYMMDSPRVGDNVVPEMLLKVLEPYRKEGLFLSSLQTCRVLGS